MRRRLRKASAVQRLSFLGLPISVLFVAFDKHILTYCNTTAKAYNFSSGLDNPIRLSRTCKALTALLERWLDHNWKIADIQVPHLWLLPGPNQSITISLSPSVSIQDISALDAGYLCWHPAVLKHRRAALGGKTCWHYG